MTEALGEELLMVPIDRISTNPLQPRKRFDEEALRGLAQSIRTQGVLQPLIVRQNPKHSGNFELVAGERRWRALKILEHKEVPVLVRSIDDQDLLEVTLLENIQRENLTPIEEAQSYRELLDQHGYTQEVLSRRLGRDRSTIANLMRLLQLPEALQNDLEYGRLSIGHARALLALPNERLQLILRTQLIKQDWSVRETERRVREQLDQLLVRKHKDFTKHVFSTSNEEQNQMLQNLEEELQRHLGTRVAISYYGKKGEIRIHYQSLDEFERLYSLLKSS